MKERILFLPGLNGLRAIASLSVMITHIAGSVFGFNLNYFLFGLNDNGLPKSWLLGSYGVTIFFVLSGFLITYLLILEKEKGSIDIKKFYMRRILRIWPLYYLYFFICLGVIAYMIKIPEISTLFFYMFFLANIPFIFAFTLPFLEHFWSIGVEEQFYIFWPWLVKKTKNFYWIVFALIVILNIIRYFLWWRYPFSESALFSIVNRFDCMMVGGLGAVLFYEKNSVFMNLFDNKISQLVSWSLLILLFFNIKFVNAIVDTTIVTFISLVLIIGQIGTRNRVVNLDLPFFNFIGKISYGIYVYHVLIIYLFSIVFKSMAIEGVYKAFFVYGSVIFSTIFTAYLSYEFFESKFIHVKNNFTVIKSSSSKN